jgi:hypothetical protein
VQIYRRAHSAHARQMLSPNIDILLEENLEHNFVSFGLILANFGSKQLKT